MNKSVILYGPAGSGKTVIARELASARVVQRFAPPFDECGD